MRVRLNLGESSGGIEHGVVQVVEQFVGLLRGELLASDIDRSVDSFLALSVQPQSKLVSDVGQRVAIDAMDL